MVEKKGQREVERETLMRTEQKRMQLGELENQKKLLMPPIETGERALRTLGY